MKSGVVKKLSEIASFKSGGTPSKSNPHFWGGTYPWVSAKDMKSRIITDSLDHLTSSGFAKAKIAPKNSLLLLVRGMTLYKDVPICLAGKDIAFNQDIKALIVSDELSPEYLQYYLISKKEALLRLVDSAGHGTGRMDTKSLASFSVFIPPFTEQKAITNFLAIWDSAIEKTERLIAAKKRLYSSLLQTLINQRCDEWKHLQFNKIFDTVTEKGKSDSVLLSVTQDCGVIPRSMLKGRVMSPEGSTDL